MQRARPRRRHSRRGARRPAARRSLPPWPTAPPRWARRDGARSTRPHVGSRSHWPGRPHQTCERAAGAAFAWTFGNVARARARGKQRAARVKQPERARRSESTMENRVESHEALVASRRSKRWLAIAAIFTVGNLAGGVVAAAQGEIMHASVHAGLMLLGAVWVWLLAARRDTSHLELATSAAAEMSQLGDRLTLIQQSIRFDRHRGRADWRGTALPHAALRQRCRAARLDRARIARGAEGARLLIARKTKAPPVTVMTGGALFFRAAAGALRGPLVVERRRRIRARGAT